MDGSTTPRSIPVAGVRMPTLVYGTAWKEERTAALVRQAIAAGFRGIDTANQRKHYHEAGVGAALKEVFASGLVARDDLFVQTKFTYPSGQDHRLPYDPQAPVAEQVAQSFQRSLEHLGLDRIDSYVLHGPSVARGLAPADQEAWRAMEALHKEGRVGILGVSNVSFEQLAALHDLATVKPSVVQDRTFTRPAADREVRAFCAAHGMAYQGFSLLTAIPQVVAHRVVGTIAARHGRTAAQVVLRYCLSRGMVVLTGTTSPAHMTDDMALHGFDLSDEELAAIDALVG